MLLVLIQLVMIVGLLPSPNHVHGRLGRLVIDISVGDLNGDGSPDVAVGTAPGTIYAINTTGSILWSSQVASSYVTMVKIADFNRDGIGDILAGSLDSNTYVITREGIMWTYSEAVKEILALTIGNLDGDDVPDVVVGSADNTCYAVAGATGKRLWRNIIPLYVVFSINVADLDADGLDDAVAADRDGVYAINGLTGATMWINREPLQISSVVTIKDLDKDGIADIVVGASTHVYALSGATGDPIWVQRDLRGHISVVAEGDFNGDQLQDIVVGTTRGNIYALEGSTGNLLWENLYFESLDASTRVLAITVEEFNEDGVDDILVGALDSCIYVLSGSTGKLQWRNPTLPERIVQVVAADLNDDGICDALAASGPNVFALDGLTGTPLWDTIDFWEYMGHQVLGPVTGITVGLVLGSLYILSWDRKRKIKELGETHPFWFGQGKLGGIFATNLVIVGALSWAVRQDWIIADAATKLWLSFLSTSFPIYITGLIIVTMLKSPEESKRLVIWVTLAVLLVFAVHMGVFLYGLPTKSSL